MLGIIAAVLIVLWLLGFFAFHVSTGLVHILLVIGGVMLLFHLFRGRSDIECRTLIRDTLFTGFTGVREIDRSKTVDPCTRWHEAKRSGLLIFWIAGSVLLGGLAFYLNWKLGAVWSVFAVLGFVVIEKMLMRRGR